MLRFVVAPDRTVVPDILARLPGRGIWLSARRDVLDIARTRGAFARAARGPALVPPDLVEMVEAALERRVMELLGLARRAGQAVAGFQKAREWVTAGRAGLVVQASDGSPEERARFTSGAAHLPAVRPLSAAVMGGIFGRERAVHVAVSPGRLAAALEIEAGRLAGVSGEHVAPTGDANEAARTGQDDAAPQGQMGKTQGGQAALLDKTQGGAAARHDDGTSG